MCEHITNQDSTAFTGYFCGGGVSPAFEITGAASGDARKRSSAVAASGCAGVAVSAPAKENPGCSSAGIAPTKVTPGGAYQLADLLEADLRLATRDDRGHRLAGRRPSHLPALARDLVGDAELGEQRGRQIGAAAAVRIGDGFCRQQRAPECLDAADIGLWRARAARPCRSASARARPCCRRAPVRACRARRRPRHRGSRHPRPRPAPSRVGMDFRRVAHRWTARRDQMVTARAFESRAELGIGAIKSGRDHHVHIGGRGCPRHQQRRHGNHGQHQN